MPSFAGVSLNLFKTRLNLSGTTYDEALLAVLNGVERSAVVYLGFDPGSASAVEYYDGNGSEYLPLRRRPVPSAASVANVWLDENGFYGTVTDSFNTTTTLLTSGTDYALKIDGGSQAGILVRINSYWPVSRRRPLDRLGLESSPCLGCVKVEYTAGYTPAQMADFAEAVYEEAASRWQKRFGLGIPQSESLNGRSLSFSMQQPSADGPRGPFLNADALTLLQPHRLRPFA